MLMVLSLPLLYNEPNPTYARRLQQDQLLLSTINLSLFENVLAQVLECTTSSVCWSTIQTLFLAKSNAHVIHTKYQLATLRKGCESISKYFNRAKTLVSSLGAAGQTISDIEFIVYLFIELGTD